MVSNAAHQIDVAYPLRTSLVDHQQSNLGLSLDSPRPYVGQDGTMAAVVSDKNKCLEFRRISYDWRNRQTVFRSALYQALSILSMLVPVGDKGRWGPAPLCAGIPR